MRAVLASSLSSQVFGRSSTVTPCSPPANTESLGGTVAPSTTTSRWGRGAGAEPSAEKRGRSRRSDGSMRISVSRSEPIMRAGPSASCRRVDCAWGSHFAHSHCGSDSGLAAITICRSSGLCRAARWQSMPRARPRMPATRSPTSCTLRYCEIRRYVGRSGWVSWVTMKRWAAVVATGSRSATGGSSGGTSVSASGCAHVPTRTVRKSSSDAERSHTRVPSSTR